jgi:hypothetical protein
MNLTQSNINTINNTEHLGTSKYTPIKTSDLIKTFEREGFSLVGMQEARYRKAEKESKVRHVVRMSLDVVGDIRRDIVIMNSADGSSSLRLHMGLHRFSCANGLVVCDDVVPSASIRHSNKDPYSKIHEFVVTMKSKLEEEQDIRECMMRKIILPYEMRDFAHEAMKLREDDMSTILDSNLLNIVNRREDIGSDLFVVYNRIQENLMKGNYKKFGTFTDPETGEMSEKYKSAKILTAGDRIIDINKSLHELALNYI